MPPVYALTGWNPPPFCVQDDAPSNGATRPGHTLKAVVFVCLDSSRSPSTDTCRLHSLWRGLPHPGRKVPRSEGRRGQRERLGPVGAVRGAEGQRGGSNPPACLAPRPPVTRFLPSQEQQGETQGQRDVRGSPVTSTGASCPPTGCGPGPAGLCV